MLAAKDSIYEINESHKLIVEMKHEVEKYQKLLSLAEQDRINIIKHNVNYYTWLACYDDAMDYFRDKQNGIKNKEGKEQLDYYKRYIELEITNKPVKIIRFSAEGWESYCKMIIFTCDKQTYEVKIPDIEKLNKEHFFDMNYGMMTLSFQESEHCWGFVGQGYENSDLRNAFQKFTDPNKHEVQKIDIKGILQGKSSSEDYCIS